MAIKKRPQTPLSSRTWIVQDPLHREVNARTDCYPCQMGSAKSLYTMTAQCLDLFDKLYSGVDFVCKTFKYHGQSDPALPLAVTWYGTGIHFVRNTRCEVVTFNHGKTGRPLLLLMNLWVFCFFSGRSK